MTDLRCGGTPTTVGKLIPTPTDLASFVDMDQRAERLHNLLTSHLMHGEVGGGAYQVWPDDDDGGEMRIAVCLRDVLPYLDGVGLSIAEKALLG
jgi:hypothetical protein